MSHGNLKSHLVKNVHFQRQILGCRDPRYKHENPSVTLMNLQLEENSMKLHEVT